ncbi:MAG: hypothetical protein AVDCRST_MAG89-5229, partial [uncultured Gemmatimonadetes bacterium]
DGSPPSCPDAPLRRGEQGGSDPATGPGARGEDAAILRDAGDHLPGAGAGHPANKSLDL